MPNCFTWIFRAPRNTNLLLGELTCKPQSCLSISRTWSSQIHSILLKLPVLGLRLFLATTAIHSCHNTPRNELLVQPSPELKMLKGQEMSRALGPSIWAIGDQAESSSGRPNGLLPPASTACTACSFPIFPYYASNMHLKLQDWHMRKSLVPRRWKLVQTVQQIATDQLCHHLLDDNRAQGARFCQHSTPLE